MDLVSEFAADVRAGLGGSGQKTLPSKYLYDDIGSLLFEVICLLPEYGVTRAEGRVLRGHADEIADRMGFPAHVVELGAGTGKKARWILGPLCRRQPTTYYPIDISPAALEICRRELASLESLTFKGFGGTYLKGMEEVGAQRPKGKSLAVLFLGSTLGNFDGLGAGALQKPGVHQAVVDHHVGLLEAAAALHGDQARIARPRSDQVDFTSQCVSSRRGTRFYLSRSGTRPQAHQGVRPGAGPLATPLMTVRDPDYPPSADGSSRSSPLMPLTRSLAPRSINL